MTGWLSDWVSEWLGDWVTEWLTGWLSHWVTNDWVSEWLGDWVTNWQSDCVTEWLRSWVAELGDWVAEWLGEWLTAIIMSINISNVYIGLTHSNDDLHPGYFSRKTLLVRWSWHSQESCPLESPFRYWHVCGSTGLLQDMRTTTTWNKFVDINEYFNSKTP